MDVNGVVIAASEVIKFEEGHGIIFTICNTCMNFRFYILAKNALVKSWKKIYVNHFYNFSHLKSGAIEWLSGTRKIVLLATIESRFREIRGYESQKIHISSNLIKLMCIPDTILNSDFHSVSKLISYQGIITKVKNSDFGLYEIDNKIHLYCIFNSFRSLLPAFKEGDEVVVSNAHFFTDFKARKILVCCGLSSVRSLNSNEENTDCFLSANFCQYSLSIFDIIWLEMLLVKLNAKFHSTVISSNFVFDWKNEIIDEILTCFSSLYLGELCSKRSSLGDEYCSSPHSCGIFCEDILPTGCEVLCISDILDRASNKISWTDNSDNWKTCFVENCTKYILVGLLYLSKDGCWYIKDKSYDIPVVFTQSCSQCKFVKNAFCLFDDLNIGHLIVLQTFDIVYEKIKYKCDNSNCYRYIKTSCCYIFYLGTFSKQKDNLYHFVYFKQPSSMKLKNDSVNEITESLKGTHLDKQNICTDVKENSFVSPCRTDLINNNAGQSILVLNKLWTIVDKVFVCYQILVSFLPQEKICEEYLDKSKSLFVDTSNFYDTDDDYEFAELVSQIDSLYLEDKPRLARLHFESTRQCALMLPGHIYTIDFSSGMSKDVNISPIFDGNNLKPLSMKIKHNMKILHHMECLGNHYPDDYEINTYCSIKEIISEKKVKENCLIRAILKDKLYERSNCYGSTSDADGSRTFCLVLKDCSSRETIKVYLPFCPRNMYGFLPGIQVQMYGFVCLSSKRGFLYLKPSSSFGLQIINFLPFHRANSSIDLHADKLHSDESLKISSLQGSSSSMFFKCMCFIIKIVSVKLYLICNSCGKEFEQKCSCVCSYHVKLSMNFIIDDGTEQMLAYSCDETAKKVLMLSEDEFEKLSEYVLEKRSCLNFHYKKIENGADSSSLMEEVFSIYCSSKFLCREMCLKCKKNSDNLKIEQQTVWCHGVLQTSDVDLIPELITKLKNIAV